MVKVKVDSSVQDSATELLALIVQDKVKKQIKQEILKRSSRFRINPATETLELEIKVEIKKVRR